MVDPARLGGATAGTSARLRGFQSGSRGRFADWAEGIVSGGGQVSCACGTGWGGAAARITEIRSWGAADPVPRPWHRVRLAQGAPPERVPAAAAPRPRTIALDPPKGHRYSPPRN